MADAVAADAGDETSLNQAATSPTASQKTPTSPQATSAYRQVHDTYKVITPVNSPKRAPATTEPVSPQSIAVVPKRPNLHLNLSVIKSAPSRPLVPSATGRVKKVTRDIAALDFLQNIPMSSEYYGSTNDSNPLNSPVLHDSNASGGIVLSDNEDDHALAGRRLPGPDCQVVRMPPLIRYRMTTKYPPASATVRLWEGNVNEQGLLNGRIFLSSGKGYPVAVTSVIKYNGNQTKVRHPVSYRDNVVAPYDWRGKAYFQLLHASWSACDKDRDAQDKHPVALQYRQGRHKDVIRGDRKLGPVVSSILRFVKPNDLKEELNKQFRETHTWLHDTDLSLSKIRNLKQEALLMGQRIHLDISTIALACVYFEKLVLENYVTKPNRKLYMSACLVLAVKFNEPRGTDDLMIVVKKLLVEIDQVHSIPSRDVLAVEFKVYAELSFGLHVPLAEIQPHFTRLLKCMESNPRKYLGEDIFTFYSKLVHDEVAAPLHSTDDDDEDDIDDDCTDGENLLSDAEELEDEPSEAGRTSLFPWNQVSFAQWWKDRT